MGRGLPPPTPPSAKPKVRRLAYAVSVPALSPGMPQEELVDDRRPSSQSSSFSQFTSRVTKMRKSNTGGHSHSRSTMSQSGSVFFDGSIESLEYLCSTLPGSSAVAMMSSSSSSFVARVPSPVSVASPREGIPHRSSSTTPIETTLSQRKEHPLLQPKPTVSQRLRSSWTEMPPVPNTRSYSSTAVPTAEPYSPGKAPSPKSHQQSSWLFPVETKQRRSWGGQYPKDLLPKIESKGWARTNRLEGQAGLLDQPWHAQQKDLIAKSKPVQTQSLSRDRIHEDRCKLLDILHRKGIKQGVDALRVALCWKCGSLQNASKLFDAKGPSDVKRLPYAGATLLEFAGCIALLGLDVPGLCGTSEQEIFEQLDADRDHLLSLHDLQGESKPCAKKEERDEAVAGTTGMLAEELRVWTIIVKFVALSAWFLTPDHLQRRLRNGAKVPVDERPTAVKQAVEEKAVGETPHIVSKGGEEQVKEARPEADRHADDSLDVERPVLAGSVAMSFRAAAAGGEMSRASNFNLTHQQLDEMREKWSPFAHDLSNAAAALQEAIVAYSTVQQAGEQLLSRLDFFNFLGGDFPPKASCRHSGLARLTPAVVGEMYDRWMAYQVVATSTMPQGPINKGLTFESIWDVLYEIALLVGLHFRHIVEDAWEARKAQREAVPLRSIKPAVTSVLRGTMQRPEAA